MKGVAIVAAQDFHDGEFVYSYCWQTEESARTDPADATGQRAKEEKSRHPLSRAGPPRGYVSPRHPQQAKGEPQSMLLYRKLDRTRSALQFMARRDLGVSREHGLPVAVLLPQPAEFGRS